MEHYMQLKVLCCDFGSFYVAPEPDENGYVNDIGVNFCPGCGADIGVRGLPRKRPEPGVQYFAEATVKEDL